MSDLYTKHRLGAGRFKSLQRGLFLLTDAVYHLHAVDIRVTVAVHHRRLVYQNTLQTVHRAFYRSLADGIDDAQQLRGFQVIRCLAGRMPFSAALSHLLTP